MSTHRAPMKWSLTILFVITTILAVCVAAFFTDRVTHQMKFTTTAFTKDGYALARTAPNGPFVAGEDVTFTLKESNTKDEDVTCVVTITVKWDSPDKTQSIFGNQQAKDNAKISIGDETLPYTLNADGTITFDVPKHVLTKGTSEQETAITLHIPESLQSTGNIAVVFDKVIVNQHPDGFTAEYDRTDLNADQQLDFAVKVGWAAGTPSKADGKTIMGYLTVPDSDGKYGIDFEMAFNYSRSPMKNFTSADDTPWTPYKDKIVKLNLCEGMTTIGDNAFADLKGVNSVTIPSTVTGIGKSAFDGAGLTGTVTIPKNVNTIQSLAFGNLPDTDSFVFEHDAGDTLILPDNSSGKGAFYVGDPYSQTKPCETKVVYNNNAIKDYNWGADNRGYRVAIWTFTGGIMTADRAVAIQGQEINLTATPEGEYRYGGVSYSYVDENGNWQEPWLEKDILTFTMPESSVTLYPYWQAPPMLAEQDTWFMEAWSDFTDSYVAKDDITEICFVDQYEPDWDYVADWWDASDPSVPESVMAYLEYSNGSHRIVLAGNGYGKIYANKDSSWAFGSASHPGYDGPDDGFYYLASINGADILDTSKVESMREMFSEMWALESIDVSTWDTGNVTDMGGMFAHCNALTALDVSNWETSNVTVFSSYGEYGMFTNCRNLETLDVSNWDTSKVTSFVWMFTGCDNLKELDVRNWDTSNVLFMDYMFTGCDLIEALDVSDWNTSKTESTMHMFDGCSSLKSIDISDWDMTAVSTSKDSDYMFEDCTSLTSLTLPMTLTHFGYSFAYNCTNLTEINFLHDPATAITFPPYGGAFKVPSYLKTTFDWNGNADAKNYDWVKDNRMKVGITDATLKYDDVAVGETVPAQLDINPSNYATPQSKKYEVVDGYEDYIEVDEKTGKVTGLKEGDAKVQVTIIDANGKEVTAIGDVKVINLKPVLAAQESWYTQGGTSVDKNSILSISLQNEPYTGSSAYSWDASDGKEQTVYAHLVESSPGSGTYDLIIAGNGYGSIYANPDSRWAFGRFGTLTSIDNLDLLNTEDVNTMAGMFTDNAKMISASGISAWNTSKVTDMSTMFYGCSNLTGLDVSGFDTANVTNMNNMFFNCSSLTSLDVSGFDTANVINMGSLFHHCRGLKSLDVSGFDTARATNMRAMFSDCQALLSLDVSGFDTALVTNMSSMFANCFFVPNLDVSGFDTARVTNMGGMFAGVKTVTTLDVTGFDTSRVTDMSAMFNGAHNLTSLDVTGFDTARVTNLKAMFSNCSGLTTLDVSGFNTALVTDISFMFGDCTRLTSLDLSGWDVSKVTTMNATFNYCQSLTTLDLTGWTTTAALTNLSQTFRNCSKLMTLDLSGWNTSNVTSMSRTFLDMHLLQEITLGPSFTFVGTNGYLPAQTEATIPGAHGVWYNKTTGAKYTPEELAAAHGGTKYTYILTVPKTAFAVLNTDGSMVFYYRSGTPAVGDSFDGKTVAAVYTGFDTATYASDDSVPWYSKRNQILTVSFKPEFAAVQPVSTACWFWYASNMTSFDGANLNTNSVTTMSNMFSECSNLTTLDSSGFVTNNVKNMASMFNGCSKLTTLDVSGFNTKNVTYMGYMFNRCSSLTSLDVSGFDTDNVTSMNRMFNGCSNLTVLDVSGFVTNNVTDMNSMFYGCSKVTALDVSGFVTNNVANMGGMFSGCSNVTALDVSGFVTNNVKSMSSMFNGCSKLTTLDTSGFSTNAVTDLSYMFCGCSKVTALDVSGFATDKVTNMAYMFKGCSSVTTLDVSDFVTNSVTNMSYMFDGCNRLSALDLSGFATNNVTNMDTMFNGCVSLTVLDLSGFATNSVTNMTRMFCGCTSLTTIYASDLWSTAAVTLSTDMFKLCSNLAGDLAFDGNYTDATYAKTSSGYLTYTAGSGSASAASTLPLEAETDAM